MSYAHEETIAGHYIRVEYDNSGVADTPRDYSNLGTVALFGNHKHLGDDHPHEQAAELVLSLVNMKDPDTGEAFDVDSAYYWMLNEMKKEGKLSPTWGEVMTGIVSLLDKAPVYYLPVYIYQHSGIAMNTTGFACRWDSGQAGIVYVARDRAEEEYGPHLKDGETVEERALACLKSEIEALHLYVSGSVFRISVWEAAPEADYDDLEPLECYSGFLGELEEAIASAKESIPDVKQSA